MFLNGTGKSKPENASISSGDLQRKSLVILFGTTILAVPLWSLIYWLYNLRLAAIIPIVYSTVATLNIFLYWIRGKSHFSIFLVSCFSLYFVLPPTLQWVLGGYQNGSAVLIWMFPVIVAAFIYQGTRSAIIWGGLFISVMILSIFSPEIVGNPSGAKLPDRIIDIFFVLNIAVVGVIVAGVVYYLVSTISRRSKDLGIALSNVTQLKELQDSDYFLISYLSNPLSGVSIVSRNVKIEYLIEQKKRFSYKNKHHEIGGDICIAEQISLRGKTYSAFLNGDAMGKSLQGAAGAIIMGSLFRAAVNRNKNHRSNLLPELWLQNCYSDFQQLFESFDGSMLMSVVFGLLDEACGMLYYFNAEHPWVVLLRQGSTSFIGAGSEMRKLGVPEIPEINEGQIKLPSPEGLFRLNTVMLQSKDIIYLGSDGRDDLLMKDAVTGRDSMNMDESLFLKAIEMAGNKLHAIRDYLQGHGEFTDDLSLMSVSFSSEENLVTDKSLRKQSIEQGLANVAAIGESRNFASAAAFAEDCTKKFPEISSFYRLAGFYHRKSGNMQAAADYGEAYRIRKGADVRNLLHLAGIYIRLGNHNRAKVLVQKAQTLSPKDERVKKAVYALRL